MKYTACTVELRAGPVLREDLLQREHGSLIVAEAGRVFGDSGHSHM